MQTFISVHHLRGLAAMAVVLFHASGFISGYGTQGLPTDLVRFCEAGVDVFFVISGFILTIAAQKPISSFHFMMGRFARVGVPYWTILLILAAATIAVPSAFRSFSWQGSDLLLSLAFIPSIEVEGAIFPILQPGWTLSLEMVFYLLLAAGLSLSLTAGLRSLAICAALAGLAATGLILDLPPGDGVLWFFTQTMLLEFCFGIAVAHIYLRWPEIGKPASLMLIALGLGGLAVAVAYPPEFFAPMRTVAFGIPATFLVAGAVFLERAGGCFESRILMFLGTVSYSLYLTHILALGVAIKLMAGHLPGLGGDMVMLTVAIAVSLAGAFVYYRVVEQPSLWLSSKLKGRRPVGPQTPLSAPSNLAT